VGYVDAEGWFSFPDASKCKPCDKIGENNCRWKIINVDKIVRTKCLKEYANLTGSICFESWVDGFENCSAVESDTSALWLKGADAPSNCPRVISGCIGDTFPAFALSNSGCSHQCIQCSRKSELAYPTDLVIEALQPTGVTLSWSIVNSTLYGDPLYAFHNISYNIQVTCLESRSQMSFRSILPTISISSLQPASKYSIQVQAEAGTMLSERSEVNTSTRPSSAKQYWNAVGIVCQQD
jgi:hypothetical protein